MMQDDDLISRAAARDIINTWGRLATEDVRMDLLHHDLNALPAVDAVPVIHAHWIEFYEDIMCSHCKATYYDDIVDTYHDRVDYRRYVGLEHCPHCGSIMDGGDEDEVG